MNDDEKTRDELLQEVAALRSSVAALEAACQNHTNAKTESQSADVYFRLFFEMANDIVLVHEFMDTQPRTFIEVNETACRVLGYSRDELLHLTPLDIITEPDRADVPGETQQLAETGGLLFEKTLVTKAGEQIPVEIHTRLFTQDGRPIALAIARDISARKFSEKRIRESEEQFRLLTEQSLPGIYILNEAGTVIYVNPSFAWIFGYEVDEVVGKLTIRDLIHPDDIGVVSRRLGERLDGQIEPGGICYKAVKKDGSILHIEVYGVRLTYQGRPAVMGTLLDVTARKQVEENLRDSEATLVAFINSVDDSMFSIDRNRRLIMFNAAFAYRAKQRLDLQLFTGMPLLDHFPPAYTDVYFPLFDRVLSGESFTAPVRVLMPESGIDVRNEVTCKPLYSEAGAVEGAAIFVHDITTQYHAQEELRESKAMLEAAFHNIQYAINVGHNGIQVMCNAASAKLFGYDSPDDFVDIPIIASIAPDERPRIADYARRRVAGLPAPAQYETRGLRKDGSEFDMDVLISTYEFNGETFTLGAIRDITGDKHLQQAEREQRELNAVLLEQQRELTQKLVLAQETERQRIAHELHDEAGQALTALSINLQVCYNGLPEGDPMKQKAQDALHITQSTARYIRNMAYSLRPPLLDSFGLNVALQELCETMTAHPQMTIGYSGDEITGYADVSGINIYRIVQEALTNVVRHAKATHVNVSLGATEAYIVLEISDDGAGFDMPATGSTRFGGLGLLGMCERVNLLKGEITITSEPGAGTRIRVTVPKESSDD